MERIATDTLIGFSAKSLEREYPLGKQVYFKKDQHTYRPDAPVSSMYQKMGRIYYFREHPMDKNTAYTERRPLIDESYEEALQAATKGKKK